VAAPAEDCVTAWAIRQLTPRAVVLSFDVSGTLAGRPDPPSGCVEGTAATVAFSVAGVLRDDGHTRDPIASVLESDRRCAVNALVKLKLSARERRGLNGRSVKLGATTTAYRSRAVPSP